MGLGKDAPFARGAAGLEFQGFIDPRDEVVNLFEDAISGVSQTVVPQINGGGA